MIIPNNNNSFKTHIKFVLNLQLAIKFCAVNDFSFLQFGCIHAISHCSLASRQRSIALKIIYKYMISTVL